MQNRTEQKFTFYPRAFELESREDLRYIRIQNTKSYQLLNSDFINW